MVPADQGFEARDHAGREPDDRLIIQPQRFTLNRIVQIAGKLAALRAPVGAALGVEATGALGDDKLFQRAQTRERLPHEIGDDPEILGDDLRTRLPEDLKYSLAEG